MRHVGLLALLVAPAMQILPSGALAADVFQAAKTHKEKAISLLKMAQTADQGKAVLLKAAVSELQEALALLEKYKGPKEQEAGVEMEEINSLIYWARKVMPVVDLPGEPRTARPPVAAKPDEKLAQQSFNKAQEYAKRHPGDAFLIAIRYYEVADRFQGTKWSLDAQRLSLEYQRKSLAQQTVPTPVAPEAPKVDRDAEVTSLEDLLRADTAPDVVGTAIDRYLAQFAADPLEAELEDARRIVEARDLDARVRAARSYFANHPNGRFAPGLARFAALVAQAGAFERLAATVTSSAADHVKAEACRAYVKQHPGSPWQRELDLLAAALSATDDRGRAVAWATYRSQMPEGRFTPLAKAHLLRSEGAFVSSVAERLEESDLEHAVELAELYARLFPQASAYAEMRSLSRALSTEGETARGLALDTHQKAYAFGPIAKALRAMLASRRATDSREAYDKLARDLGQGTGKDRSTSIDLLRGFVRTHSTSEHTEEARAMLTALTLASPRARAVAARDFESTYPDSALAGLARVVRRESNQEVESSRYDEARSAYQGRHSGHAIGLSGCESYLAEFPDGPHAEQVRSWEKEIRQMISVEAEAYASLEKELPNVESPSRGLALCDEYLERYQGGTNNAAVRSRRQVFQARLAELAADEAYGKLKGTLRDSHASPIVKADSCMDYVRRYGTIGHRRESLESARSLARIALSTRTGTATAAAFSSGGAYLAVAGRPNGSGPVVELLRLPELEVAARFRVSPSVAIDAMAFTTDDDTLLLGDGAGGLSVVDFLAPRIAGRYRLGAGGLFVIVPSANGLIAVLSRKDTKLRLWNGSTWSVESEVPHPGETVAADADRSGGRYAVGGRDGSVAVYRPGSAEPIWEVSDAHHGAVHRVALSPRGTYLASASTDDGLLRVWNASSGRELWQRADGASFAFCADDTLATPAAVLAARSGSELARLGGRAPVAASPDGRFVFVGGEESDAGTVWYLPALLAE
jgi:hypothetical protein